MEATKVAHNEAGDLSIVLVEGRSFVHGSILDSECARRDAEIERLTAENERLREAMKDAIDGYAKGDDVFGPMMRLREVYQQQAPRSWLEAKKEIDDGWPEE